MNAEYNYAPFPRRCESGLRQVMRYLVPPKHDPSGMFSALVEGERLVMPGRIYFAFEKKALQSPVAEERQIAACFFSRHHNGYVREECLHFLLHSATLPAFSIPYILKLAEEYVVELADILLARFAALPVAATARFLEENPKWLPLMRQRCLSYWDCYYRNLYPQRSEYPGLRIVKMLQNVVRNGCGTPDA